MKISVSAFILSMCLGQLSYADIYMNKSDEVISFTDTPQSDDYSVFLRDSGKRSHQKTAPYDNNTSLPVNGRITSVKGLRSDPVTRRLTHHNGMDIAAHYGAPVKPVADGTVLFSGYRQGYGNMIIIEHSDGFSTLYAHNSENLVKAGDAVSKSDIIAKIGSTGRSTGPHLHFEAWENGVNITESYTPEKAAFQSVPTVKEAPIRRYHLADGSIAFSNLPQ